jgi:hypothetical protein
MSWAAAVRVLRFMRSSGLEPPRAVKPTRPSTLRVYQFRHERRGAEYSPAVPALSGRIPGVPCCIRPRSPLQCEHMFVTRANPPGQGGNQTWI